MRILLLTTVLEIILRTPLEEILPPRRASWATNVFAEKKPFTYAFPVVVPPEVVVSVVTTYVPISYRMVLVFVNQEANVSYVGEILAER